MFFIDFLCFLYIFLFFFLYYFIVLFSERGAGTRTDFVPLNVLLSQSSLADSVRITTSAASSPSRSSRRSSRNNRRRPKTGAAENDEMTANTIWRKYSKSITDFNNIPNVRKVTIRDLSIKFYHLIKESRQNHTGQYVSDEEFESQLGNLESMFPLNFFESHYLPANGQRDWFEFMCRLFSPNYNASAVILFGPKFNFYTSPESCKAPNEFGSFFAKNEFDKVEEFAKYSSKRQNSLIKENYQAVGGDVFFVGTTFMMSGVCPMIARTHKKTVHKNESKSDDSLYRPPTQRNWSFDCKSALSSTITQCPVKMMKEQLGVKSKIATVMLPHPVLPRYHSAAKVSDDTEADDLIYDENGEIEYNAKFAKRCDTLLSVLNDSCDGCLLLKPHHQWCMGCVHAVSLFFSGDALAVGLSVVGLWGTNAGHPQWSHFVNGESQLKMKPFWAQWVRMVEPCVLERFFEYWNFTHRQFS